MTYAKSALRRPGQVGFTVMELMITVAIVAILAAVAIFSIRAGRNKAAVNEFGANCRATFKEARSEYSQGFVDPPKGSQP